MSTADEKAIERAAAELVEAARGDRDELEYLLAELRMAVEIRLHERGEVAA